MVTYIEEPQLEDAGKIAGWLLLPAVGIVLSLLRGILDLLLMSRRLLTEPSAEVGIGLALGLAWLSFAIVVALFFFKKHRWAPWLYITMLALSLLGAAFALAVNALAGEGVGVDELRNAGRALTVAGIWVPYFAMSRRVRVTFVQYWRNADRRTAA